MLLNPLELVGGRSVVPHGDASDGAESGRIEAEIAVGALANDHVMRELVLHDYLCDDHDRQMLPWVQAFNPFDLNSKSPVPPDWNELRPYYEELINKYLPPVLDW